MSAVVRLQFDVRPTDHALAQIVLTAGAFSSHHLEDWDVIEDAPERSDAQS